MWVPQVFLPTPLTPQYASCLIKVTKGWRYKMHTYNFATFGDCVAAHRVCIQIYNEMEGDTINTSKYDQPEDNTQ